MNHLRNLNEMKLQDLLNFTTSSSVEGDQFGLSACALHERTSGK